MALKTFKRLISNAAIATASAAVATSKPPIVVQDKGYPAGEELFHSLKLRLYGNLNLTTSSAGTGNTAGALVNLSSVYVETDKHGVIVNGLDGRHLLRMSSFLRGTLPAVNDPTPLTTGTPTFSGSLEIPFAIPGNIRPDDTALYMRTARMTTRIQTGTAADFFATAGTYSAKEIQALNLQQYADLRVPSEGRVTEADLPAYVPFYEVKRLSITAAQTGYKIDLPYGDRIYHMVAIAQRDSSTGAELDNSILSRTGNVRLEVNNIPVVNNLHWGDVQDATKQRYGLETLPTGWGVIDFAERKVPMITEMLNVLDQAAGTTSLYLDVTTGSNYQLDVVMFGYKPLPPGAASDNAAVLQAGK